MAQMEVLKLIEIPVPQIFTYLPQIIRAESILAARQSDLNEQNIRLQALENTLSGSQRSLKEKTRKLHEIQANISNLVVTSEAVQASLDVVAQRHKLCLERRSM